jgi:VIT1/CCC1 family predicted Fe2+/Mn2+ transporter
MGNALADPPLPSPPPQGGQIASKLNWLRAGVLGANDGIVSTVALIFGVAGAAASHQTVLLAGFAAVAAGAMSMAVGEYVSVSTQRDLEAGELAHERAELAADPAYELAELGQLLEARGIDRELASRVAVELTEKDALAAHARVELGIDSTQLTNPWSAAFASMLSFVAGGMIPLAAMLLAPRTVAIWVAGAAVLVALAISGAVSARLDGAPMGRAILRTVVGGHVAIAITYGVGRLVGTQL